MFFSIAVALHKIILAWKEHNHLGSHGFFYCLIFAMH